MKVINIALPLAAGRRAMVFALFFMFATISASAQSLRPDAFPPVEDTLSPKALTMATTLEEMDRWNRYPTYDVYTAMMQRFVERYPDLYRRIVEEGHQVGNHTYNHMGSLRHYIVTYYNNVEKANELIHSHLFRPPHGWMWLGAYNMLRRKYKIVMWDLVTRDYSHLLNAFDVLRNVVLYTRNGSIITFHDSLKSIEKLRYALPASLRYLKEQGYEFKVIE